MNSKTNIKIRLIIMNFLIFASWGAYLCSLGVYLGRNGMGPKIGSFFAIQGIVSLFMPTLMGIVADRWVPAQKVLSLCHLLSGIFMTIAGIQGARYGSYIEFGQIFPYYALSVAFFMPTIALGNSVSYNALTKAGMDTVKDFPPIRVFGTVGFILSMWIVNFTGFKDSHMQLFVSAAWSFILAAYALTLPACPVNRHPESRSLVDTLGLRAFSLFKDGKMCIFFIFSFLLGMCLQVTNGFATPYLDAFGRNPDFANAFAVKNNVFLSSISQVSETLCILLIPFCLRKFGIKKVMLISFIAWFLRFGLLGAGSPTGFGLVLFVLSMIVYGVAFDFFNISGSLFVDQNTDESIRSSAQGVFMMMTNGFGSTLGAYCAGAVVNHFTRRPGFIFGKTMKVEGWGDNARAAFDNLMSGWQSSWYVFAAFALVLAIVFAFVFKYKHNPEAAKAE
ncbi:MAG: nucleoside permease [Bacteroidales bacterium]|nr:nucleoside permease [Bacteroidales bacterium]